MDEVAVSSFKDSASAELAVVVDSHVCRRLISAGPERFVLMPETEYRGLERKLERLSGIVLGVQAGARPPVFNGQPRISVPEPHFVEDIDRYLNVAQGLDDVLIERQAGKNVVLMDERSFEGMLSTIDIFSRPEDAKRLLASVVECERASTAAAAAAA